MIKIIFFYIKLEANSCKHKNPYVMCRDFVSTYLKNEECYFKPYLRYIIFLMLVFYFRQLVLK